MIIKWISEEIPSFKVQELLNLYSYYIIPKSLSIVYSSERTVLVTFYLSDEFNSIDELNEALKNEPLF